MSTKYIHITTVDNSPSQNVAYVTSAEYSAMKSGAQDRSRTEIKTHTQKQTSPSFTPPTTYREKSGHT